MPFRIYSRENQVARRGRIHFRIYSRENQVARRGRILFRIYGRVHQVARRVGYYSEYTQGEPGS